MSLIASPQPHLFKLKGETIIVDFAVCLKSAKCTGETINLSLINCCTFFCVWKYYGDHMEGRLWFRYWNIVMRKFFEISGEHIWTNAHTFHNFCQILRDGKIKYFSCNWLITRRVNRHSSLAVRFKIRRTGQSVTQKKYAKERHMETTVAANPFLCTPLVPHDPVEWVSE